MDVRLTIGEFSKMTYLSVKALRHYHDVGLLEPVAVDDSSGYRFYSPAQVATAQSIRRFRDLDLPLEEIRAVLQAPTADARNEVLIEHLDRMRRQLHRTELTVASLQAMLATASPAGPMELRVLEATSALSLESSVAFDDAIEFCATAFAALHDLLAAADIVPTGPDTALYSDAFFEEGVGSVVALGAHRRVDRRRRRRRPRAVRRSGRRGGDDPRRTLRRARSDLWRPRHRGRDPRHRARRPDP